MTSTSIRTSLAYLTAIVAAATVLHAQSTQVSITVDASASRHAINPAVYGVSYATTAQLQDLNAPLHRYGGNNTSRYNWQLNADNRGFDWYFESIGDASATAGQRADDFVASSRTAGAQPMLTIPMIEYVAKLGASRSPATTRSMPTCRTARRCRPGWSRTSCRASVPQPTAA